MRNFHRNIRRDCQDFFKKFPECNFSNLRPKQLQKQHLKELPMKILPQWPKNNIPKKNSFENFGICIRSSWCGLKYVTITSRTWDWIPLPVNSQRMNSSSVPGREHCNYWYKSFIKKLQSKLWNIKTTNKWFQSPWRSSQTDQNVRQHKIPAFWICQDWEPLNISFQMQSSTPMKSYMEVSGIFLLKNPHTFLHVFICKSFRKYCWGDFCITFTPKLLRRVAKNIFWINLRRSNMTRKNFWRNWRRNSWNNFQINFKGTVHKLLNALGRGGSTAERCGPYKNLKKYHTK